MSEKQNIDRLFQEKFKDFEVQPSPKVWQEIEAKLREEKDDRKVIPFWFRFAGIAAAFLIGVLVTDSLQNATNGQGQENSIVIEQNPSVKGSKSNPAIHMESNTTKSDSQNAGNRNEEPKPIGANKYETGIASETGSLKNDAINSSSTKETNNATRLNGSETGNESQNKSSEKNQYLNPAVNKAITASDKRKGTNATASGINDERDGNISIGNREVKSNENVADLNKASETNTSGVPKSNRQQQQIASDPTALTPDQQKSVEDKIAAITGDDTKTDTTAIATVVPNTLEELLKEKEKKTVTTNEPKLNRWQISTNVAPIYFSSTSNSSPIDSRLAQSSKDYNADLAFGVGVRYALNNKFTVRAGVNTVGMEYSTNDLAFVQTSQALALQNVKPNLQGTLIHIEAKSAGSNALNNAVVDEGRKFSSSLSQRTGYIEVPLEMSYKLVDKKFAVELIGGFSTLFLNENSISLISSGLEMEIGKANNLNDMHFSTNIGVGLRYNFLRNFQFNVEPMFKYQINTFSNSSNYNPYMFGLYTGLNYRF